jgi:uncharacterized protein VirK/YbjX
LKWEKIIAISTKEQLKSIFRLARREERIFTDYVLDSGAFPQLKMQS